MSATGGRSQLGGSFTDRGPAVAIAPPPADSMPPGLAEHPDYEIVRELGRGGMGVVYLVRNKLMGRLEVLKVVGGHLVERPGVRDRFLREVQSAAKLQHKNVVTAYSAMRLGEAIVLAMEYIDGEDLATMVKSRGPLPVVNACYFIHQAALGLQHAHERGMVHRDVKPDNLIFSTEGKKGVVKVLDFGLAKLTREGQTDSGLTREGQMLGTPDYIAPEQIRDAQSADIRADIYSLGCTFYFLLTGGPPFRGEHLWDVYQAHFSIDAGPLNLVRPEVPVELAAVVAKMMAKEPRRRFQTPGEVAQALAPFFKTGSVGARVSNVQALQVRLPAGKPESPAKGSVPTQPATNLEPAAASPVKKTAAKAHPEPQWESLIEFKETEPAKVPAPDVAVLKRPIPRWLLPAVAAGVLVVGLAVAWGVILRVKTANGMIELVNLPKDAEVLVDGDEAAVTWPGGGKPAVITVTAGKRRILVKKDGLEISGDELTVKAEGIEKFTVRLVPPVKPPNELPKTEGADSTRTAKKDGLPDARPRVATTSSRESITNSVGMRLVLIPAGEFMMGMTPDAIRDLRELQNAGWFDPQFRAAPKHRVTLTKPRLMGATEVTVGQFRKFVEATGYMTDAEQPGLGNSSAKTIDAKVTARMKTMTWRAPGYAVTDDSPVTQVTWKDAVAFCNWLSAQELLKPCYQQDAKDGWSLLATGEGYRLPTEAEWEYACQAGSTKEPTSADGFAWLEEHAWFNRNQHGGAMPVATKSPNAFGLFDMRGNVFEWCHDWYRHDYYPQSPPSDPLGPSTGDVRVQRGGGWSYSAIECHSWFRTNCPPSFRKDNLGFRVVLVTTKAPSAGGSGGPHTSAPEAPAQRLVEKPPVPTAAQALDGFQPLFNGKDLTGWVADGLDRGKWSVSNGELLALGETYKTMGWLLTDRQYKDFRFRCEFLLTPGSSAGFVFRAAPGERSPHLKLADDQVMKSHFTGSIVWSSESNVFQLPQHAGKLKTIGEWNELVVEIRGDHVLMEVNGALVNSLDLKREFSGLGEVMPRLKQPKGRIGFQKHTGKVHFRNVEIKVLNGTPVPTALKLVPEARTPPVSKPTASSTDALQPGTSWRGTSTALVKSYTNEAHKPQAVWLTIKARTGTQFKAVADSIGGSHDAEGTFKDGVIDWKVANSNSSWEGKLVGNQLVGTFKGTNRQGHFSGKFRLTLADGLPPKVVSARVPPIGPARGARSVKGAGWIMEGDQLIKEGLGDAFVAFGDPDWTNYDVTFQARKSAGPHGFGCAYRQGEGKAYVLCIGGLGGEHSIGHWNGRTGEATWPQLSPGTIEPLQWYTVKIMLRGQRTRVELDGHPLFECTDDFNQRGSIALKFFDSAGRFRNIKVTAPDGTVLWEGPPDLH